LEAFLAQCWLCGIVQMGEKDHKVDFGFKVYVLSFEVVVALAILTGAWLINKVLLAPPLIVAFRLTRVKIETKYDVYHCASILVCMVFSTLICLFGVHISLPMTVSLISNILVGVGFAIITWYIQDIINIKKRLNEKDNLIARCKAHNYNELKTEMAVKFFVEKQNPKDVWLWLCETQEYPMSWDSVKNLKHKMKKDLF
jgi:hypothetical protein